MASQEPTFTILLPLHRPPRLLPYAVESVLAQERQDFELIIICDGAPADSALAANALAHGDERIRALVREKGARHGEQWRHEALQTARGQLVAHINDDDLWFPTHLGELEALLVEADFGNLLHVEVSGGQPRLFMADLSDAALRGRMLTSQHNVFGPTVAGYRLAAYRRLPVGWSPAPAGEWTDLHMWRKFLAQPWCRVATRVAITSLHFNEPGRDEQTWETLEQEARDWSRRIACPESRQRLIAGIWQRHAAEFMRLEQVEQAAGPRMAWLERRLGRAAPRTWANLLRFLRGELTAVRRPRGD